MRSKRVRDWRKATVYYKSPYMIHLSTFQGKLRRSIHFVHVYITFVIKMPSSRQRSSANAIPTVSLNEKILKECNDLYTEKEKGKNA